MTEKDEMIDGIRVRPGDRILYKNVRPKMSDMSFTQKDLARYLRISFALGVMVGTVTACVVAAFAVSIIKVW